jgi:hypothetical protein
MPDILSKARLSGGKGIDSKFQKQRSEKERRGRSMEYEN